MSADQGDDTALREHLITWGSSPERDAYVLRRLGVAVGFGVGAVVALAGVLLLAFDVAGVWRNLAWVLVAVGSAVALYFVLVPYWSLRFAFGQRRRATATARVDMAIERVCSGDARLPLPGLFELNRRQLDKYQDLTRQQQRTTFVACQIASGVAFAALIAGVVISLRNNPGSTTYVAAGLSGLGALLATFLAKVFFDERRVANEQLRLYYLEPQRTGRLLAAERLVTMIDPKLEPDYLTVLLQRLMSWEVPGDSEAAPSPDPAPNPGPSTPPAARTPTRKAPAKKAAPLTAATGTSTNGAVPGE